MLQRLLSQRLSNDDFFNDLFFFSKVGEFWQEYTTKDVLEILGVFASINMRTGEKVLRVISQWLTVNVHALSEGETLAVIYCLHKLEYIDDAVIREEEDGAFSDGLMDEQMRRTALLILITDQ